MARVRVKVRGLRELERKLERLEDRIHQACHAAVTETAEGTRDFARKKLTVETIDKGNLYRGVEAHVKGLRGEAGVYNTGPVDLYYAQFVEWGTSKMRAEPFMTPASVWTRMNFRNIVERHLRRVV